MWCAGPKNFLGLGAWRRAAMVATGDVVYLVCRGRSGKVRLRGRVVDLEGEEVVVGFEKDPGISLPHSAGCPPKLVTWAS